MKKKYFVITAAGLCGLFLTCQLLLHHRTVFTTVSVVIIFIIASLCAICFNSDWLVYFKQKQLVILYAIVLMAILLCLMFCMIKSNQIELFYSAPKS